MIKQCITVWMLICCIGVYGQEKKPATFVSPFDFPLTLSGNFGEIRSNHFHGGLDFKTGGAIGKPVRALADGYISRIRVTNGSGYVLDVCYHNGYSTINRHLNGFISPIAERVKKLQYENESWEVEIVPEPGEYPVKGGQQIAWSGNTGYSFGPHLHLDVFETESGDYIDPMPFFKSKIKDTRAPKAEGIMFFPQPGKGVVDGKQETKTILPNSEQSVEAWGVIGTGIKAYDYMDGTNNRYGVYSVVLTVDGNEVFRSTVDRFSQEENRMINSWTCGQYMKSFLDPGSTLRLLKVSNDNRGLVTIDEERDYRFLYTLKDAFGNTSKYGFIVRGRNQLVEPLNYREKYFFAWDKTNYLQEPGLSLVVPKGMLYDDVPLNYQVKADSGAVAFTYQINDKPVSLHAGCELCIGLRRKPMADTTKYYMVRVTVKGKKYSVGGKYQDGCMKAFVRELGTYTVAVDTIPPEIIPVNKNQWGRNGKVVYRLKDEGAGIASYRGTIDGKYALFGRPNIVKPYWECKLDSKHVKKGGQHTVEFTVTDNCGNKTVSQETFMW